MKSKGTDLAASAAFLLYQTEDGRTRIDRRLEDETLWLSQAQMAELFQTTPQNITQHLKAIYEEGEQSEAATCKEYLQVRSEGMRQSGASAEGKFVFDCADLWEFSVASILETTGTAGRNAQ